MKRADGPSWQLVLAIAAVVLLVAFIAFIAIMRLNLGEGASIIQNLIG